MGDKNELKAIIKEIYKVLNLGYLNIKDLTNILYLVEWNFVNNTGYRLFYYNWTNCQESNIKQIRKDIIENNIKYVYNYRYEDIYITKTEYKISSYIKLSIDKIKKLDMLLNKTEFYFYETLPFDLFYDTNKQKVSDIDIVNLVNRKNNKEY